MTRGLYHEGNWAILQKEDGSRTIVSTSDYEASGCLPPLDTLDTDTDYHVGVLAHGWTDPARQPQQSREPISPR